MKASGVPIIGILGPVIVSWDTKKNMKNGNFRPWKVINPLIIPKPLDVRSWNLAQYGCLWMLYANRVWGARSRDQNFTRPKMGKKVTSLNRYISVITDIDEKIFAVFEHTINRLSFGYVCLPQLENYFSCFRFFLLLFFFFFLLPLSTFKPLNAPYAKV